MTLRDYIDINNLKQNNLAAKWGISEPHLSLIASGQRRPSPEMAALIEQATGGAVTRLELLYPVVVSELVTT